MMHDTVGLSRERVNHHFRHERIGYHVECGNLTVSPPSTLSTHSERSAKVNDGQTFLEKTNVGEWAFGMSLAGS